MFKKLLNRTFLICVHSMNHLLLDVATRIHLHGTTIVLKIYNTISRQFDTLVQIIIIHKYYHCSVWINNKRYQRFGSAFEYLFH